MRPVVGELLLARVAGAPATRLEALALPGALAALADAGVAHARRTALAPAVGDALRDLVPAPGLDRRQRRAVLALKRDVHNGRRPSPSEPLLAGIARLLPPDAAAALGEWRAAEARERGALALAQERLDAELARAGAALVETLAEPELARALALASPDLLAEVTGSRTAAAARPESRLARSCTAYLARACVKTSPFSTFTQVALAGFEHAGVGRGAGGGRSTTLVSRALATDLLQACATDARLAGALRYAANPGLVREGWPPRLVTPRYTWVDGFAWRHDRVTEVGAYERLLGVLARVPAGDHAAYLRALGGPGAHAAFARMIATGMVRPVAPWTRGDRRPLAALADALEERAAALADALREIEAAAEKIEAAPGRRRAAAVRELRAAAATAYRETSRPAPSWLRDAPLVHEDVAAAALPAVLPECVREELARLGERMRPRIVRSRIYDELVAHFVTRHGAGGRCDDVLALLASFMARRDAGRVLAAASQADWAAARSGTDGAAHAPVGPATAPPAAGVFFQLAAADAEALHRGEFLLVPNQYNAGTGGLLARYLPLLGEQPALAEALREWLRALYPGVRVVELPVAADWNDLQRAPTGLLPPLAWPGELPTAERAAPLRLADLAATHDALTRTLTLTDPDGRPVAPVYLGTVPPHLVLGPLRLLLTLADPWVVAQPEGAAWSERGRRRAAPATVERRERRVDGRLAHARARWSVPADDFPVRRPDEDRLALLARADRWRREHGIPPEVFATVIRRAPGLRARERKPLWVRFDSLHALEVAGRLLDEDAIAVELVESLPGPGERWLRDDAGAPRAVEHVALLRWPRPAVGAPRAADRAAEQVLAA